MHAVWIRYLVVFCLCGVAFAARAQQSLPQVEAKLIADGLKAPILLVAPNDGSGRAFVAEQSGEVYIIDRNGTLRETLFLDLRDAMVPLLQAFDERGLLGLAFHPDFAENGLFYVNYSAKPRAGSPFKGETAYTRRLSEFRVSRTDPDRADPASERILMEIDWVNRKHNGGGLAFGPDGYLYFGVGDGGGVHGVPDIYVAPPPEEKDSFRHAEEIPEDPFRIPEEFHKYDLYAQDTQRLQGKILRIDVNRGHPGYGIPPTNPFSGNDAGIITVDGG